MYELYEPSERVFVDREEYIDWMTNALSRCKDKSVVLHLRGIGGIGKSALVEQWNASTDQSILLDCSGVTDFYDRLDTLARGAARFGMDLRRFDVLWHIRQRFVKGVEPAREEGRGWVMDILAPLDLLVPITSVPRAIKAIGEKLKPILTGKLDALGKWLQTRLGKDYASKLLEVLWKEPSHAEFLYLNALLEDLNDRKAIEKAVLVMLDGYETVDKENLRWNYGGKKISEAELWYVFLSSLVNSVGVIASRHSPVESVDIEQSELTELDKESCMELLERRGISDEDVQTKIASVSGGNPFVINCICDIPDSSILSMEEIENLGADSLEEVRVKTWRRLFSQTEGLLDLIDRAGLVPFIDRRILSIIAPSMKSAHWNQITKLSFVRDRGDGTLALHSLAQELILTELGDKLITLTEEVSDSLEQAATKESDWALMGMALSAKALAAESDAMAKVQEIVDNLRRENRYMDAYLLLENVSVPTDEGKAPLEMLRGRVLYGIDWIADAEQSFRVALDLYRRLSAATPDSSEFASGVAGTLARLGGLLRWIDRPSESEAAFWEAIAVYRQLSTKNPEYLKNVAETLCSLAFLLLSRHREKEAEDAVNEAIEIFGQLAAIGKDPDKALSGTASTLIISGRLLGLQDRLSEAEAAYRKAIEIYRDLPHKDPDNFLKSVGATLHRLAFILLRRHNAVGAEAALQEELDIFRDLAEKA
ncbi:MAG: tetratricopeptide repeat protein, partial [Candidatus Thorarchaeota archaeon]